MGVNAVIPAAVNSTLNTQHRRQESFPYSNHSQTSKQAQKGYPQSYANVVKNGEGEGERLTIDKLRAESYGSVNSSEFSLREGESSRKTSPNRPNGKGKDPIQNGNLIYEDDVCDSESEDEEEEFGMEPEIPVTWRYMSRLYLLVPIITFVWLVLLLLLVRYAWPPTRNEREAGQEYPHPLLWKPFAIGIFASCTVQIIRVPIWVVVSWFQFSQRQTTFWSTTLHAVIHELLRLSTLPLIFVSPTSGFHSSYYLGLGWGLAEVTWGIIQGWEQIELYKEVMKPSSSPKLIVEEDIEAQRNFTISNDHSNNRRNKSEGTLSSVLERNDEDDSQVIYEDDDVNNDQNQEQLILQQQREEDIQDEEDEEELERKVEILERMRARRDLEEVLGLPFPNIPFPLHLLWRLDTLLLNLGLTLTLSSFYFNSAPIYRHNPSWIIGSNSISMQKGGTVIMPDKEPHKWLWQVWVLVAIIHICVSLVWKVVGRVGIGAVTWGGLIVALGSVFAGLGCWGGLV
ncbi:uncharacterized protein L201_006632 [Kwoniella dendrophila CBS 6074]|uniref:Uncharacterized protein n=1 Tax=Kwoniella dendrophila CBS 6074 TaxID=1295534 RepID=A0AAX4K286_9TREE